MGTDEGDKDHPLYQSQTLRHVARGSRKVDRSDLNMSGDKKRQKMSTEGVKVSSMGGIHSFTYNAAMNFFSAHKDTEITASGNVRNVFESVRDDKSAYGVLPVESSSSGSLQAVLDNLLCFRGSGIEIVGESREMEKVALISTSNVDNDVQIDKVIGHPLLLEATSLYLDSLDTKRISIDKPKIIRSPEVDSSTSCQKLLSDTSDEFIAAIAPAEAANAYGLKIMHEHIASDLHSETRYIVIAKTDSDTEGAKASHGRDPLNIRNGDSGHGGNSRSKRGSLVLISANEPGAIMKWSSCFALRNINILKIESRPAATAMHLNNQQKLISLRHFDILMYVDYQVPQNSSANAQLLSNLREFTSFMQTLGTYNNALDRTIEVSPSPNFLNINY